MDKKTLYKVDSKGRQREWSIWVEKGESSSTIVVEAGLLGGNLVRNEVVISTGKNTGKSNETNHYTQAVSEAESTYDNKLRSGYVPELGDAKQHVLGSGIPAPMLAQKYHPTGEQKGSKTLEKMKLSGERIHVQPKLDGNRCLIKVEGDKAVMYTRKGDVMPVQLQHLLEEVLFCYNQMDTDSEIILDGELFSRELSFNELNGHLKRKDSQDPDQLAKIKFHLYDCMENLPYDRRYENLQNFLNKAAEFGKEIKYIELIPSYEIEASDEAINEKLEKFLAEGHEGLMIRRLDTPYENKRSWQLCKCKVFEDAEYELVDIEQDVMGRLGKFIMKMDRETYDRDGKLIETFGAGATGITHEEGRAILADKAKYIGKKCTVEFFGLSEFSVPRFPKWKGVREDI